MPRTTYTELQDTLDALQRAAGVTPGRLGIARSANHHCVVIDAGTRDVSPWLPIGQLRDWIWAAVRGAHLLREDSSNEKVAVLLDTGCDWPEVVFVGSHDEAGRFVRDVVLPALEAEGDEAIYYTTAGVVTVKSALEHRRSELLD